MGQWIERRSMPTPRHDLQSVAVDGSIYAISGAGDLTLGVVEIYDVANGTWSQGPPIPTARGWLGADLLDGKIYAAGGKTVQTREMRQRTGIDPFSVARCARGSRSGDSAMVRVGSHATRAPRRRGGHRLRGQDLGDRWQHDGPERSENRRPCRDLRPTDGRVVGRPDPCRGRYRDRAW